MRARGPKGKFQGLQGKTQGPKCKTQVHPHLRVSQRHATQGWRSAARFHTMCISWHSLLPQPKTETGHIMAQRRAADWLTTELGLHRRGRRPRVAHCKSFSLTHLNYPPPPPHFSSHPPPPPPRRHRPLQWDTQICLRVLFLFNSLMRLFTPSLGRLPWSCAYCSASHRVGAQAAAVDAWQMAVGGQWRAVGGWRIIDNKWTRNQAALAGDGASVGNAPSHWTTKRWWTTGH